MRGTEGRTGMIETGIKGQETDTVVTEKTAAAVGSGTLNVYGTPCMIALIEETCLKSVAPFLSEEEGTVGTELNIKHVASTPVGMKVRCESELTEVDRRRLVFTVKVYDEVGLIGEGTHERFIINNEKFQNKTDNKAAK